MWGLERKAGTEALITQVRGSAWYCASALWCGCWHVLCWHSVTICSNCPWRHALRSYRRTLASRTWRTAGGGFGRAGSGPRRDRRGAGQLEGRLAGLQPAAVCAGGPSAARWLLAALLQEGGGGEGVLWHCPRRPLSTRTRCFTSLRSSLIAHHARRVSRVATCARSRSRCRNLQLAGPLPVSVRPSPFALRALSVSA
jgi:hypothetical protein